MLEIEGYTVGDRIYVTSQSEVYMGLRDSDGLEVVFKRYRTQAGGKRERAQREFELLARIDGAGIVRPVELRQTARDTVLVLERFAGMPLSRYTRRKATPVFQFLVIAAQVAESLAAVHDARVIHKDLKPDNVLVHPEDLRTCLIDFGIAAEFGGARSGSDRHTIEGSLHYVAPEQTGRIGLAVDFRTDLYSLGATLYELLTGQPPFRSTKAMDLINAHIAMEPRPPIAVEPKTPCVLSRLVMKLLEKDPELRYQTARGLHADLSACLKQLHSTGEIDDDLVLGAHDASDRLRFPGEIFGRKAEIEALQSAFERVSRGAIEVVFLAGPPGIGKSSLPSVLRKQLARTGAYLAQAKFDLGQRERPFSGFSTAFASLMDQILAETSERLRAWGEALGEDLGKVGAALLPLIPDLALIVPDLQPVPSLGPHESKQRLVLAVRRLVRSLATHSHPLILFFDDLQWADAGSRFLLEELVRECDAECLLILGSYRDNEVGDSHPLADTIRFISEQPVAWQLLELSPLALEDTNALIAEVLCRHPDETYLLSERVHVKAQSNPLLVRRFLLHLWESGVIRHDFECGWVWDQVRLAEVDLIDDAASIMAQKIGRLCEASQSLLRYASIIGDIFDRELLLALAGGDRLDLLQNLMSLAQAGLIMPCREGFRFAHDRIRETAQALIPDALRADLHDQVARWLLEHTPPDQVDERIFEIADHIRLIARDPPESDRISRIEIQVRAGRRALRAGAPVTSDAYLRWARAHVRDDDWRSRHDLGFELYLLSAETAFQLDALESTLELVDVLERRARTPFERAQAGAQRILVYALNRPLHETLACARGILRETGLRLPVRAIRFWTWLAFFQTECVLRRRGSRFFTKAPASELEHIAPLLVVNAAAGVFGRVDYDLALLCCFYAVRIFARRGYLGSPGLVLACHATLSFSLVARPEVARRDAACALEWTAREPDPIYTPRAIYQVHGVLYPWLMPRREALAAMAGVSECCLEAGDTEWAYYVRMIDGLFRALAGDPVELSGERFDALVRHRKTGFGAGLGAALVAVHRLLHQPTEPALPLEEVVAETFALLPRDQAAEPLLCTYWMLVLCVKGRHDLAFQCSEQLGDQLFRVFPYVHVADHSLFRGLAAGVLAAEGSPTARRCKRRYRRELVRARRRLRRWARSGPDFVHMEWFLEAEEARLRGRDDRALALYQSTIERALRVEYPHHAALALERQASLLFALRRASPAAQALRSAIAQYRTWGASGKAKALKAESRAHRCLGSSI